MCNCIGYLIQREYISAMLLRYLQRMRTRNGKNGNLHMLCIASTEIGLLTEVTPPLLIKVRTRVYSTLNHQNILSALHAPPFVVPRGPVTSVTVCKSYCNADLVRRFC